MPKLELLIPKATTNYVKNPSFRNSIDGWIPNSDKVLTFENGLTTPYPTGFDSVVGSNLSITSITPIRGDYSLRWGGGATGGYGVIGVDEHTSGVVELSIDPRNMPFAALDQIKIINTSDLVFDIFMQRPAADTEIKVRSYLDSGAVGNQTSVNIDFDSIVRIRVVWSAASAPGANDGFLKVWLNGALLHEHTGIDNDTLSISSFEMGATGLGGSSPTGHILFDDFAISTTIPADFLGSISDVSYENARFGFTSMKTNTYGYVEGEGIMYRSMSFEETDSVITGSIYVRGEGKVRLRLYDARVGKGWVSESVILRSDSWDRLSASGRVSTSNDMRLYVETVGSAQEVVFYADGAQLELHYEPTTFCDGDEKDCRWNGEFHNSVSERFSTTRSGGEYVTLVDEECKNDRNLYFTLMTGFGMPPSTIIQDKYALRDGAFVQGRTTNARTASMTFHVKNKNNYRPIDLGPLHALRQQLIDYIKPDLVPPSETEGEQPFVFRYTEGRKSLLLECFYDSGLEESWDIRNQWTDTFNVRFLSANPFFTEDTQESQEIKYQDSILTGRIISKQNGVWKDTGFPRTGSIGGPSFIIDQSNQVLYGFTDSVVYRYDGEIWDPLGTISGPAGSGVNEYAIDPNGNLYIGGRFTAVNGVAANNVAYFDFSDSTWKSLDSGVDGDVLHLEFSPSGDLYIGGKFLNAGGIGNSYIVRWDGSSYHSIGAFSGLNNFVQSISFNIDGSVGYVSGEFTDEATNPGSSLNYVATFLVADYLFTNMDTGFDSLSREIKVSSSNNVYSTCGVNASGSEVNYMAQWNGTTWQSLGDGLNGDVYSFDFDKDDNIIVVGPFTEAGSVSVPEGIAIWNGSVWSTLDILIQDNPTNSEVEIMQATQDIFISYRPGASPTERILTVSGINDINNIGSSISFPTFFFKGTGKVRWIQSITNGAVLFLNYDLSENEELVIDTEKQEIISSFSGKSFTGLLSNSDLESILLYPNDNKLVIYMINDVDAEASVVYKPLHWSIDGVKHG